MKKNQRCDRDEYFPGMCVYLLSLFPLIFLPSPLSLSLSSLSLSGCVGVGVCVWVWVCMCGIRSLKPRDENVTPSSFSNIYISSQIDLELFFVFVCLFVFSLQFCTTLSAWTCAIHRTLFPLHRCSFLLQLILQRRHGLILHARCN